MLWWLQRWLCFAFLDDYAINRFGKNAAIQYSENFVSDKFIIISAVKILNLYRRLDPVFDQIILIAIQNRK